MKKIIVLMLCLQIAASFIACGSQDTPNKDGESTEQTGTPTPEIDESEPTATPTPETDENKPAFDTSWAGDEYEMPIPKVPFTQYDIQDMGGMYMIKSTSPDEIAQLTEEDFVAYCNQLKDCLNFTNIQKDEHYENNYGESKYGFGAATEDGLVVELDYGAGGGSVDAEPGCVIVVVCP